MGTNFHCCKWPFIEQIISPSGHTDWIYKHRERPYTLRHKRESQSDPKRHKAKNKDIKNVKNYRFDVAKRKRKRKVKPMEKLRKSYTNTLVVDNDITKQKQWQKIARSDSDRQAQRKQIYISRKEEMVDLMQQKEREI